MYGISPSESISISMTDGETETDDELTTQGVTRRNSVDGVYRNSSIVDRRRREGVVMVDNTLWSLLVANPQYKTKCRIP